MKGYYVRNIMTAIFGVVLALAVSVGLIVLEGMFLQTVVAPSVGDIEEWIADFKRCQDVILLAGAVLALLWHFGFGLGTSGRSSDHRIWWAILWFISVVAASALSFFLLPNVENGAAWAYLFAIANGAFLYWMGTVWCTASAHKYAPLGSFRMRRLAGV